MKINPSEYSVLVVDDVETNVLLLKVLLMNEGYRVTTAQDGQSAIHAVEESLPDLILLDVLMPDMTGFEVAKHLKNFTEYKDIPIIFLTALDSAADTVKGFNNGGNDYVTKPFIKDELLVRVKNQLSLLMAKRIILEKNRELQDIIVARDKMYSVIAHDLRTPMASMKMITNLLTMSITEQMVGKDMYDMIQSANSTTEDIFSLLDNLLKWTKSQTGRMNTITQNTDIVDIVESTVQIFVTVAAMKDIKLVFDTNVSNTEAYTDIDMLKTCIRNLISNAIKFSYKNSAIKIYIDEEESRYIIRVEDAGCGMDEESRKNLLRTDTHFSTYGTAKEEGSGLGLLLVQDFARRNGGELWFKTEEKVGSTFFLSVPKPNASSKIL